LFALKMLAYLLAATCSLLMPTRPPTALERRAELLHTLQRQRTAVAEAEMELRAVEETLAQAASPAYLNSVAQPLGYLSKTAGCYQRDGLSGPPPSAITLARKNFVRELKEMVSWIIGSSDSDLAEGEYSDLKHLKLDNGAIWQREARRPAVPAPLVIKAPYYTLCGLLDSLFDGRPIARFWFLETVARIPYFSYSTMITLYETVGWWRRSAELKKVHAAEEWNEFHHLLIMEALGGDQRWVDRFVGQHSALLYYGACLLVWLISPTLAYNFSELIEAHAVDTYAEFLDANELALKAMSPPAIAVAFYSGQLGEEAGASHHLGAERDADSAATALPPPLTSLYDVFRRIRDDEARHVESMMSCQDEAVRDRARIVEFGALMAAALIATETGLTFGTVAKVESLSAPLVAQVEQRVEAAEADVGKALREAELSASGWKGPVAAPYP